MSDDSKRLTFPRGIAIGIVAVWLAVLFGGMNYFGQIEMLGQFGDMFGSLNVLFTGLALAALIYTILLQKEQNDLQSQQLEEQREELRLQREELKLQREEMAASRGELANQTREQRNLLRVTLADLHMRIDEAMIAAIELRAAGVPASVQERKAQEIDVIIRSMRDLLENTVNDIMENNSK